MLLDDLVKASVVQLDELGEIVDIGNDITQVLLEQHKLFLARSLLVKATLIQAVDNVSNLVLADGYASGDLHGFDLLFGMNLFELALELADEASLVVLGPLSNAIAPGSRRSRSTLKLALEAIVIDIVPLVFANDARP